MLWAGTLGCPIAVQGAHPLTMQELQSLPCCSKATFLASDSFGRSTSMSWCQDLKWPLA